MIRDEKIAEAFSRVVELFDTTLRGLILDYERELLAKADEATFDMDEHQEALRQYALRLNSNRSDVLIDLHNQIVAWIDTDGASAPTAEQIKAMAAAQCSTAH
jgi:hypothetical protein